MTHRWAGAGAALPAALLIHAPPRRQATRSSTRPPASRTTTKRSGATSSSPCCCLQFLEPQAGTLQFACLFSTTPHTLTLPTSHHAQPRAIASASHARASGMHTPTRQPHTPCGPSVCACPASCVRLCVMSTSYLPPHGVTPPPGVKTSGRSKKPLRL